MLEYLAELRDHWDDPYWHLDHPEVKAVVLCAITGALGLLFAWLQMHLIRPTLPRTTDV